MRQLRATFDEFLKEAKERGSQKREEIEADLESRYRQALEKEKTAKTLTDYHDAQNMLAKLNTYKDAKQHVEEIAAQEKKKEKKNAKLLLWAIIVAAIVGVIYAVVVLVVVPQVKNHKAATLFEEGDYSARQAETTKKENYRKTVSAGASHTVGLKSNGTVVAAGNDDFGKLDVEQWQDIIDVSAGWGYTIGLKSDGTVVATGDNTFGQCDVEDWKNIVDVSARNDITLGLKSDGTVVATGNHENGAGSVSDWKDIIEISTGVFNTVGLKSDGTVVATEALNVVEDKIKDGVKDWKDIVIKADCAEPKAIRYYKQSGFRMKACKKFKGSRAMYTKKVKRFKKIVCSDACPNTIDELQDLTFAVDKDDEIIEDEFNIDPHTLSAIWYALDDYEVSDLKGGGLRTLGTR